MQTKTTILVTAILAVSSVIGATQLFAQSEKPSSQEAEGRVTTSYLVEPARSISPPL